MLNILISVISLIVIDYQFEVPKVFMFLVLCIFLIFILLFNIKKMTFSKKDRYYLLWLVTLLISGLLSEDPITSILGGSYRHQGLIFFIGLYLLIKYIEILTIKQKNNLYKYTGIVVLIESFLVIFGIKLGTIGEINAVAGFLAIGFYFVKVSFPKLLLLFPIISILINFSKSGILALLSYIFKKMNLIWIVVLIISIFVFKPVNTSSLYESRGIIWKYAVEIIKDDPILGYGAESNERLYDKKFLEDNVILANFRIDRAHNLFLDITIWSGLAGLFFFVMFLYESYKVLDFGKREVLFSFLVYAMFQPLSVVHWILFALIV